MKRSLSRWILAAAALAALQGCGTLVNGQTLVLTNPNLVDITVTNSLQAPVCRLWMTPIDSNEWGLDWMAGQEQLAVGAQRGFRVPRGHWDLKVAGCGDSAPVLAELPSLAIDEAHNTFSLGQPPSPARRPYVPANAPAQAAPAPTAVPVAPATPVAPGT